MLFKRRREENWAQKLRGWLWPRRSFVRSFTYFAKRVLRLRSSPHAIALGVGAGIFASFLPFLGFHFLLAGALAYAFGGNLAASALGTAFGNPLTFPFIWALTLESGRWMLHPSKSLPDDIDPVPGLGERLLTFDFDLLWTPLLKPMTVGGLLWGTVFALIGYFLVRSAVGSFRQVRRRSSSRSHVAN